MASLGLMGTVGLHAASSCGRKYTVKAAASRSAAGSVEQEKGPFDWVLAMLQKDQLVETDPVLQKVEGKGTAGSRRGTGSVSVASNKKPGGFGGLFAKKD